MKHTFDINQDELIKFTKKLDRLKKSDLPLAVRSTLNDVAFKSKELLPNAFNKQFTVRKKNFIKSSSGVNKSPNTFELNKMYSEVGILKGKSEASDNLEQQEKGGAIKGRDFIPLETARIGKSEKKLISKRNYLKNIKGKNAQKAYKNNEFRRAGIKAGKNGVVLFNNILIKINSINKTGKGLFIKSTALYTHKNSRSVSIKKRPFMAIASSMASKDIPELYRKNAEYRINKFWSK